MKERSFTLKSYRKGLALHIKPEAEMETLLVQLTEKFRSSRAFFGNLQVGLALSGRELTQEEEDAVLDVIEENSDLQIVCLIGKDEKIQYLLDEALEENTPPAQEEAGPDGQFYRGTLRKGQSLDTEHSVIILGDVNQEPESFPARMLSYWERFSGRCTPASVRKISRTISYARWSFHRKS